MLFRGLDHCPDSEQYKYRINTKVRKFNRTHLAYSTVVNTTYAIDDTMSVSIEHKINMDYNLYNMCRII